MRAIGGYFELELPAGKSYHEGAKALNTGRNAFEYILESCDYRKVFIPYYTCKVLLQPLARLGIEFEYYTIDETFEPLFDFGKLKDNEAFLYTNYWGLKGDFIALLSAITPNLIVDNAQAFFDLPADNYTAFYSPRKFFGVPDGGYAYSPKHLEASLPADTSAHRFEHLLLRAEQDAEAGYSAFVENDAALDNNPLRSMSVLTQKLLAGINYGQQAEIRRANYQYLDNALHSQNKLQVPLPAGAVPMVYPFLSADGPALRTQLIANRIYVAQYWPEVCYLCKPDTVEHTFAMYLLPLPIDQRLRPTDLNSLINILTYAH